MANSAVVSERVAGLRWVYNLLLEALCIKPLSIYSDPTIIKQRELEKVALAELKDSGDQLVAALAEMERLDRGNNVSSSLLQLNGEQVVIKDPDDLAVVGILDSTDTIAETDERNDDTNVLFCVVKGSLTIKMDSRKVNVSKGDFYMVGKSIKRSLRLQPSTRVYYIQFP